MTADTAGTRVDYAALKRSSAWQKLVFQLGRARPRSLASRADQLAFWINAYNILAIQMVVDHYPVASIRDIGSFLRPVWKRTAGRIDGESISLDEIEHDVLRKLGEPRIHAAIVCASTSCPSLRREPYTAEGLDDQLESSTRAWIASPTKGLAIDEAAGAVRLSRIFDWFASDFEKSGGVLAFVADHASPVQRAWLRENGARARIEYFEYDWTLNDVASRSAAAGRGRHPEVGAPAGRVASPERRD